MIPGQNRAARAEFRARRASKGAAAMKVGALIALFSTTPGEMIFAPGSRTDHQIYKEELALHHLVEPLGMDSLWAIEHHFTGYQQVPNNFMMLSYFASRTKRIQLGTAVSVLPWHDPVEIAENVAMLDVMSDGRTIFGIGRGAATVEYNSFRIPMEEARGRFSEATDVVLTALREREFSYDGQYFKIPRMTIRPRPISHPEERFYYAAISPESSEMMARKGLGIIVPVQRDWETTAADVNRYRVTAREAGFTPRPPIILVNVCCMESGDEARELAYKHMGLGWDTIDAHYRFSDGHLNGVKGYEYYAKMTKTFAKLTADSAAREKAVEFFVNLMAVGTPQDCLDKIAYIRKLTGLDHFVGHFTYGGMSLENCQRNMRLFAEKVIPALHHDRFFTEAAPSAASP
jgi:alkanesulfonate monooxygenase SsuD/methylene tetrahydromethanopterin reductase-like flavin-dependent oxidoreductase (luciferase family)